MWPPAIKCLKTEQLHVWGHRSEWIDKRQLKNETYYPFAPQCLAANEGEANSKTCRKQFLPPPCDGLKCCRQEGEQRKLRPGAGLLRKAALA